MAEEDCSICAYSLLDVACCICVSFDNYGCIQHKYKQKSSACVTSYYSVCSSQSEPIIAKTRSTAVMCSCLDVPVLCVYTMNKFV